MNIFEQGLLTYLSKNQLERLQSTHIGIAGCGGLGSNIALMLVRCGFNTFTLLDFDIIEPSNLNRQQYNSSDIGKVKVDCLIEKITAINPDAHCTAINTQWSPKIEKDPFASCNILIEAFDQPESKSALIDYYNDTMDYIISGNGMAGISGPPLSTTRRGNILIIGDGITDTKSENPPMAPRVTMCASMMAQAVLKLILTNDFS